MTTPNIGTLARLRALATEAPTSITDLHQITKRQATVLREQLASNAPLLTRLVKLIPSLRIEVLDGMLVDSTAFWGNRHWHIHVTAGGLVSFHHFAALHELKHIIDHPLRQRLNTFTDADWESVANYFATQVLTSPTATHTDIARKGGIPMNPPDNPTNTTRSGQRLLTVTEAGQVLRVSRWQIYQLINSRRLPSVLIGRRRLIPADDLDTLIAQYRAEGAADAW